MILTERIWSFTGGVVTPRMGAITLDEGEYIADSDDLQRPVYVKGLQAGDFAVFLSVSAMDDASTGCLVSSVDSKTGEGIIIGGDAVEQRPRLWLHKSFSDRLLLLEEEDWAEFGLVSLGDYLRSKIRNPLNT
jgi:hypothetical protein